MPDEASNVTTAITIVDVSTAIENPVKTQLM
jgi:hypothetical protein